MTITKKLENSRLKKNDSGTAMKKFLLAALLFLCLIIASAPEKSDYKTQSPEYPDNTTNNSNSRQAITRKPSITADAAPAVVNSIETLVASDHQSIHQADKVAGSVFKAEEWRPQVREAVGPEGHQSIKLVYGHSSEEASFEILQTWDYSPEQDIIVPFEVKSLHEQVISIAGFMFPLSEGEKIKAFCLMATTQTCCYGPKPQFNQFILVESSEEVTFERIRPVKVTGKFFIDPQPQDGYIFRMEAEKVVHAAAPKLTFYADPGDSSPMPWLILEQLRPASVKDVVSIELPDGLIALNQKKVTVGGHYLGQFDVGEDVAFMVGNHFWDRCCQGTPPDIFNAVMVFTASSGPDLFYHHGMASFSGILEINTDRDTWMQDGIIRLKNARLTSTAE